MQRAEKETEEEEIQSFNGAPIATNSADINLLTSLSLNPSGSKRERNCKRSTDINNG